MDFRFSFSPRHNHAKYQHRSLAIILILFTLYPILIFAQSPNILWVRTIGHEYDDVGYDVKQTSDGGYIIVGSANFGIYEDDIYLIKTDKNGDTLWTQTWGWFDSHSYGYEVQQTFDKGYIVVGQSYTGMHMGSVAWIRKVDSIGAWEWTKMYQYDIDGDDWVRSVKQTPDSGYIIVGYADSTLYPDSTGDIWFLRTDAHGDTLWTKTYGGEAFDEAYSVQLTADGGYLIAGNTYSSNVGTPDSANIYLIKTDSHGKVVWDMSWGGDGSDYCREVCETNDGGYVIVGYTSSFGAGLYDIVLLKIDAGGAVAWAQTYGTSGTEIGSSVDLTYDGGFIIAGNDGDVLIIKTDSQGNEEWTKRVGGAGVECGWSVQQTIDSSFIIAGSTESFGADDFDVYLISLESRLGIVEEITYSAEEHYHGPTIISGPLLLPGNKNYSIYDITGREIKVSQIGRGIFFIKNEENEIQKVVKIK